MALKTVSDLKSTLLGGGARPNLFEVEMATVPKAASWPSNDFSILCKGASLPASNIAAIDVPFRGRIFKVAGDRTFDTWTVTVINDENFALRSAFEGWVNLMSEAVTTLGATNPAEYMTDATVHQLGRGSKASSKDNTGTDSIKLRSYDFKSIFPTNVSAIDLSYDSSDTIEEFTVEFAVQYWQISTVAAGGGAAA